jgi:diaminopimelate decarboxylase
MTQGTSDSIEGRAYWWERDDLRYDGDRLWLGGADLETLARAEGTPLYVYDGGRIRDNLRRLHDALAGRGLRHRIFYAMKSNRFAPLLELLRASGACGIDACSPREVGLALRSGFDESQISFTGTSLSNRDLQFLAERPELWINCDSLSSIRRLGEMAPGRSIGVRINTAVGVGYSANELLRYSGSRTTKFGIYREQFAEALELAEQYRLKVIGLHFHSGCGYLTPQLPELGRSIADARWFVEQISDLRYVNVGGGLGIPLVDGDDPLDLDRWADLLRDGLGDLDAEIWIEPGDYIVKDSGVLLLEVNTVERKRDTLFVGVDGGFNIHIEPAFYRLPLHVVPCRRSPGGREGDVRVTVAGNINEALDLLAEDVVLPSVAEGEILAFLNAGGYGSSMSSDHCMRGELGELLLP